MQWKSSVLWITIDNCTRWACSGNFDYPADVIQWNMSRDVDLHFRVVLTTTKLVVFRVAPTKQFTFVYTHAIFPAVTRTIMWANQTHKLNHNSSFFLHSISTASSWGVVSAIHHQSSASIHCRHISGSPLSSIPRSNQLVMSAMMHQFSLTD